MSYNGYESQDAFHEAMRARWAEMLSTEEGREAHRKAYGPGTTSHAACSHGDDICVQSPDSTYTGKDN